MNQLDKAVSILKGDVPPGSFGMLPTDAENIVLRNLIEQYALDIRAWELDKQGFCQGSIYRRFLDLLEFDWEFGRFRK